MTSGNWWRLFGFLIIFLIGAGIMIIATYSILGLVVRMVFGELEPFTVGALMVSLATEIVQAAAYVVCAYLTGMRDCEVQAMRRGCLWIARSEDGLIERHRIRSTLYKGRSSIGAGMPERSGTWPAGVAQNFACISWNRAGSNPPRWPPGVAGVGVADVAVAGAGAAAGAGAGLALPTRPNRLMP